MTFLENLQTLLGPAHVLTGAACDAYLTDWRGRYHGSAQAVVRPGTTAEVAAVVRLCAQHGVVMVPQGGNTGMCGAATPDGSGAAVVYAASMWKTTPWWSRPAAFCRPCRMPRASQDDSFP